MEKKILVQIGPYNKGKSATDSLRLPTSPTSPSLNLRLPARLPPHTGSPPIFLPTPRQHDDCGLSATYLHQFFAFCTVAVVAIELHVALWPERSVAKVRESACFRVSRERSAPLLIMSAIQVISAVGLQVHGIGIT